MRMFVSRCKIFERTVANLSSLVKAITFARPRSPTSCFLAPITTAETMFSENSAVLCSFDLQKLNEKHIELLKTFVLAICT